MIDIPKGGIEGIEYTLRGLDVAVNNAVPTYRAIASLLSGPWKGRFEKMRAFVDALHQLFIYRADPINETLLDITSLRAGDPVDADDACLFVAALARCVDIPCRFVAARYRRSWTLFLAYEDEEGRWVGLDVLRQTTDTPIEEICVL